MVQLFTRKGEGVFSPTVGVGVGRYGTRKADAGFSGSQGDFNYTVGLADQRSSGFNSRPIAGQNPDKDGYQNQAANASLGLRLNPVHRLDATLLASTVNSQYDSSPNWVDERNHHKLQALGMVWQAKWTDAYTSRLSLTDATSRYETTPAPYLTQTHLNGVLFQNELRQGANLWTATAERRGDQLDNAATAASTGINKSRSQNGLALGWGYVAGGHTLQLNARHDQDSEFGGKGTGSAAYAFAFTPQWRATASLGNAFRAPTLYQRFSEYGVATLKPEASRNLEVGLKFAQGPSRFSAVAYQNKVTNLINFSAPGTCLSTFGCYANTARAQYEGVTLAGNHRLGSIDLRGSLDLQNPRDLDTGKRLARRAKQHANFGADTYISSWLLGAEVQLIGQRFSSPGEALSLPGYALFNATGSTRFAKDWTFLARLDNLTNRNYQTISGYATPGRSLYAGVKWAPL